VRHAAPATRHPLGVSGPRQDRQSSSVGGLVRSALTPSDQLHGSLVVTTLSHLKACPAGGLRPPSGPATTRWSPGEPASPLGSQSPHRTQLKRATNKHFLALLTDPWPSSSQHSGRRVSDPHPYRGSVRLRRLGRWAVLWTAPFYSKWGDTRRTERRLWTRAAHASTLPLGRPIAQLDARGRIVPQVSPAAEAAVGDRGCE